MTMLISWEETMSANGAHSIYNLIPCNFAWGGLQPQIKIYKTQSHEQTLDFPINIKWI